MQEQFVERPKPSPTLTLWQSLLRNIALPALVIVSGAVGEYDFKTHAVSHSPVAEEVGELRKEVKTVANGIQAVLEELGKQSPWDCLRDGFGGEAMRAIDAVIQRMPSIDGVDFERLLSHAAVEESAPIRNWGKACTERYLRDQLVLRGGR